MKGFAKSYNIEPDSIKSIEVSSKVVGTINYIHNCKEFRQLGVELIAVQKRLRKEVGKYFLCGKAAKCVNNIERLILTVTSLKKFN